MTFRVHLSRPMIAAFVSHRSDYAACVCCASMFDAIKRSRDISEYAEAVMATVSRMGSLIRTLRAFFEESMSDLCPWSDVRFVRTEATIVEIEFPIGQDSYRIRIRPPSEDARDGLPLGEITLLGDGDFAGPIDVRTWDHILGVLKRRYPSGKPSALTPWSDTNVNT